MIYFRNIYCFVIYLIITCISSVSEVDSISSVLKLPPGSNSYTNSNPLSGSKVQKNDNPNVIQNLMAEGFIRSAEKLFSNNEESNWKEVGGGKVEDCAKLLPKGKEWRGNGKASRYLRNKRSAAVFTCRRAGPRRVECGLGSLLYDIVLPRSGMSQRSIGHILRGIHHQMLKRHIMGNPMRHNHETLARCSDLAEPELSSSTKDNPEANDCSTAPTLSSKQPDVPRIKRRPFEKCHFAEKRACGSCDCRCGCPCQQEGLRSHPQTVVGGSSCGCSCRCGCVHDRPAHEHLHYLPDARPYKT